MVLTNCLFWEDSAPSANENKRVISIKISTTMYFNSSFTNKDQRRKSALLKGYFGSFMQNCQLLVEDIMSYMCIFIS